MINRIKSDSFGWMQMKHIPAVNIIALAALGIIATPARAEMRFDLIVAPQTDTTLTEPSALNVLRVLRGKITQSCGPMRMFLTFQHLPASFAGAGDGGSGTALARFRNTGTSLQIVPSISRCPTPPQPGQIFGGCTPRTGPILLRDYPAGSTAQQTRLAQKWAHEMGHAQGLIGNVPGYVNSHNPGTGALMYWQAGDARWSLTPAECGIYYTDQTFPPFVPSPVIADAETDGDTTSDAAPLPAPGDAVEVLPLPEQPEPPPVDTTGAIPLGEDFLRGDWMGEFPILQIDAFQDELLPQAERAIEGDVHAFWPGAVVVLAYAGRQNVVARLEKVLNFDTREAGIEPDSDAAYQINEAKIRAAGVLSYLAYRRATGDYDGEDAGRAQELLSDLSTVAAANGISFAPDGRDPFMLAQQAALNANAGLALLAGVDPAAQDDLTTNQSGNASGSADFGVDDSYFQALNERAALGRTRNSPGPFPLLNALTE